MSTEDPVLVIDKPQFVVKLHENVLEVDLKKGAAKELEDILETNPTLRGSLGFLFQTAIPLDKEEAKRLTDKLNELIPKAKQRNLDRLLAAEKAAKDAELERETKRFPAPPR